MVQGEYQLVPFRTRVLAALITALVGLLRRSWRVRFHDRRLFEDALDGGAAVLAFWHGEQLPMVPTHASERVVGVTSLSRDGTLLAEVLRRLGYQVVRGSSSKGADAVMDACAEALQAGHSPALALDGPRGPFHHVHTGALRLSADAQRPVIYVVSHARHAIRLGSWDHFQIPLPGSRIDIAYGYMQVERSTLENGRALAQILADKMESLSEELKGSSFRPSAG